MLVALAVAGCGGDDEPAAETRSEPAPLTVPETETTEETPTTVPPVTTAEPVVPPGTDGGVPAPESEPPPDSPENDTPPPEDSPAERFEEFCNDNPGACG